VTKNTMHLLPLAEPNLTGNESRYLQECIDSGFVSTIGAFVGQLEQHVVDATSASHATAVSSGTCGLHLALQVLGVRPGDLVIVPSFTFIASANAIAHCGAQPWLLDVSIDSWNLDANLLADQLETETVRETQGLVHKKSGRRISAIMAVYALGLPADMDALAEISARYGLPLLADAAASLGASNNHRAIGQIGADLSVVSLNGNKTVTSGGGGIIFGNDVKLLDRARHLSMTARSPEEDYLHDAVGYNYRMTNLQAAVGCAQMERLDEFVSAKRQIDRRYRHAIVNSPHFASFPAPSWARSSCWISGVRVLPGSTCSAGQLQNLLLSNNIESRQFWRPLHLQPPYKNAVATPMPVVESIWRKIVPLPCSTHLSAEDQDRVINVLVNPIEKQSRSNTLNDYKL